MGASLQSNQPHKRRRRGQRATMMAEINVTPFVDVMLVLLIIFMVAAPLLTTGVPVELPETAAEPLPTSDEPPLTLSITREGEIYIEDTLTPFSELEAKLTAIIAERESDRIYLRADGAVAWEEAMQVMGALNAAGFHNLGLVSLAAGSETGG